MAINITAKTDYSYLFSGLSNTSSSGVEDLSFLSDYASIKNGSYGKLMKAYYSESASDSVKELAQNSSQTDKSDSTGALTKEEATALTKVQSATDELKESADALLETGGKSVFQMVDMLTKDENGVETTTQDYDREAIYSAVNQFVTDYNSVITATADAEDGTVSNRAQNLMRNSLSNEKMLNKIGITIGDDGKLAVDKDTFRKADMATTKTLFQGNGSYGYQVSAQSSLINYAADNAVSRAGTYTGSGTYNNAYNTGNIFNSYF